jgi:phosphatidate cytidylyltransferase
MKRIISAIVFLPIVILAVWPRNGIALAALVVVASAVALLEFFGIARRSRIDCHRVLGVVLCAGLQVGIFFTGLALAGAILAGVVLAVLVHSLLSRRPLDAALSSTAVSVFGLFYIGFFMAHFMLLHRLEVAGGDAPRVYLIYFLFLVVWGGDTAAYYVGKSIGRHPMAPLLSPKKTMEGAVGNLVASGCLALVFRFLVWRTASVLEVLVFALVLNAAGQAGDLMESLFKRGSGVKDASNLIPGHGGLLDRVDSILVAGPVFYYFYNFWHDRFGL